MPAAAIGIDLQRFLTLTQLMMHACGADVAPADNPGVLLGTAMGTAARAGRDKVTIIPSPKLADFGAWAEQLIAESTGKNGKALIPVDDEPLGTPQAYGADRIFVHLTLAGDRDLAQDSSDRGTGECRPPGRAHRGEIAGASRPGILPLGDRHRDCGRR